VSADGSEADPIRFRIGINVGDIIIEGDDILGDGVNIAARIEGIAEPGGISISEDAWRQVQGGRCQLRRWWRAEPEEHRQACARLSVGTLRRRPRPRPKRRDRRSRFLISLPLRSLLSTT
jgi:class 3 adenylate cyclase